MNKILIPKITLGPIAVSSEETRRLVKDAFPGIGGGVHSVDSGIFYALSVDSLSDQIPRLRAIVDLANHVGLPAATAAAIRDDAEANIDGYIDDLTAIYREIRRLEGRAAPEFHAGSEVLHLTSGEIFWIMAGPDKAMMEDDGIPSYIYTDTDNEKIWVLSAEEMEDGRFVLAESGV